MEHTIERVFDVIGRICTGIMDFLIYLFSDNQRKTEYDADFAQVTDFLSKRNTGFSVTGKLNLSMLDSFSNSIVIGPTGSQKSQSIILPGLYNIAGHCSAVIYDIAQELWQQSSGYAASKCDEVKVLDPTNCLASEGYNPFERVQSKAEVQKISKIIVTSSLGNTKGDFWALSAEALLTFIIWLLVKYGSKEYRNLKNVVHVLNNFGHGNGIDLLVAKTGDQELIAEYKSYLNYPANTLHSIIATCKTALSFVDDHVAAITSHDTLDFQDFRRKRIFLFLHSSIRDAKYYGTLFSILFTQMWGEFMKDLQPYGSDLNPILFCIDECATLNLDYSTVLANCRKFSIGHQLLFQSHSQLQQYQNGDARTIMDNCRTKIFMPGQNGTITKDLETQLGKFQYEDEKGTHVRNLMLSSEIATMSEALVFVKNSPPIRVKPTPAYENPKYRKLSKIAPLEKVGKIYSLDVPLININEAK